MPVNVGTLVIDLVAGTASFSASMDKMSALSAKTANDISRSLMKISAAGIAAVTAITGALTVMVKSALDSVDALDKAAQAAGTTAETLSTLQYAASLSGVASESLTMALEKLSKAELAAATGNTQLERAFTKLGVTVSDGKGHLKDSGVLYEQLAQKFAAMPDGALKTALAIQLFGKAGAQQIPMLNQLGENLAGVQKEAEQFGLVVGSDVAELSAKAHDNLDRLQQVLKGIGYSILAAVLPAMEGLLEKLIQIAKDADIPALAKSFGKEISDKITKLGEAMAFAAKHATALKIALEALAAIQISRILLPIAADLVAGGWSKVGAGVGLFATKLLGLKSAIAALGKLWDWAVYGIQFIKLLAAEEGIAAAATYVLEGALALVGGPIGLLVAGIVALGATLFAFRNNVFSLGGTTYKVRDIWNAAWIEMKRELESVGKAFTAVVNWIKTAWKNIIDWLAINTIVQPIIAGMTVALGALGRLLGKSHTPSWVKDALDQAKREREAAEKAAATTTTTTGKGTGKPEPDISGLAKPEKDPYLEEVRKLKLAIQTQEEYIRVLGATPDAIAKVTAAQKAKAVILELNNKLEEKGKSLSAKQEAEIQRLVALEETKKAIDDVGKSLVTQTQEQALAEDAAERLAAAQLRGVDAVRAATVENDIAAIKLKLTTDQLKTLGPLLDALAAQRLSTMNTTGVDNMTTSIDQQLKKLDLETQQTALMTAAWGKGDAAVAAARIQVELLGMAFGKSAAEIEVLQKRTGDITAAMQKLANEHLAEQAAQDTKNLQDQTAEQNLLTAAVFGTVDAQRQASIAAKTLAIDRQIAEATDEKVRANLKAERAALIANAEAQQAHKDVTDALALRSPAAIYQSATEALEKQVDALVKANGGMLTYDERLGIAARQQELLNQALDDEINRLLKVGSAADGVTAFFLEMQKSAISAAQVIYNALNSAFDKLSDNLANLMTGQKANWSAMLKDIGHQMAQQSIKAAMTKGLGELGKLLGVKSKADGSRENPYWVQIAGGAPATPGGPLKLPGLGGDYNDEGGDQGSGEPWSEVPPGTVGTAVSGLAKFLAAFGKIFGGGLAGGGEVEPGSAYLVGERGPELRTFGASGNIHPADETGRILSGGASVHYYTIDARGTDPVLTEQRTRTAIIAAHQSAILTSSQVQAEKTARTPPMPRR